MTGLWPLGGPPDVSAIIGIYSLTVERNLGASVVVDDEGYWSQNDPTTSTTIVSGCYLAVPSAREIDRADSRGVRVDAIARMPSATGIDHTDYVIASDIDPRLDGRYHVTEVRPTPLDLRVFLARIGADE